MNTGRVCGGSTLAAQWRGDSQTSTAFMSEEGAQLRKAHSGGGWGRGVVLSSVFVCMLVFECATLCAVFTRLCLNT